MSEGVSESGVVLSQSRTDHSLFAGLAWTAIFRWSAQLLSWVGTLYAARLLMPADYGIVAMANVPVGLLRVAENFGLDAVLVQDRQLSAGQTAQLAGLALLLGLALMGIIGALAHPLAVFYAEPRVAALIVALGLLVPLEAAQIVPRARLQTEMAFRTLGLVMFVQTAVATATVMACARLGLRQWSLVLNVVLSSAAVTVMLALLRPFSIRWPRNLSSISRPVTAGWRMLVSRAGYYVCSSSDQAIVGRVLGASATGIYSFAQTFSTLPMQEISSVVGRVVPGVFSSVQNRPEQMRRYFLMLSEASALIAFPAAAGIGVCADLIVSVALGPRWLAVASPLRVLCIYAAVFAAQDLVNHVLLWTGRFRANMWLNILAAVALPPILWLGALRGLNGLCLALTAGFAALSVPGFVIAARIISLRYRDYGRALSPALLASLLMMSALILMRANRWVAHLPDKGELAAIIAAGILIYAAALGLFFRRRVMNLIAAIRTARH